MKYEQYISLIKKLEKDAKNNPKLYRLKVIGLAILGYAYFLVIAFVPILIVLAGVLLLLVKPTAFFILIKAVGKFALILLVFLGGLFSVIWGAITSLFKKIDRPEGIEIDRENADELFKVIDEISENLEAQKPNYVLLNNDFNASVVTFPRFGFFGKVVYLNLGLPLMESVSPEQFRAVLAHEMGHISKKHGSDATWIYQLRETWRNFLENQEQSEEGTMDFLYSSFVNWYFPYFNAYSFVLAREHEREADRMAVKLYGAKNLAESLMKIEIKANYLDTEYWKNIFDKAKDNPKPPNDAFSGMVQKLRSDENLSKDVLALSKGLSVRTGYEDTHPALNERLELMNYSVNDSEGNLRVPKPIERSSAEFYLGDLADSIIQGFDKNWQNDIRPIWEAQREYLKELNKRITELETKNQSEELNEEELYELAELTATSKDDNKAAIPILEKILEKNPQSAPVKFSLGNILLEEKDEKGIELLKEAMKLDRMMTVPACEQIYSYFYSQKRDEEAMPYLKKADNFYDIVLLAERERSGVTDIDEYESHDFPDEFLSELIRQISFHEEIAEAYLVKKKVEYLPEEPFYVLGIKTKKNWLGRSVGVSDENLLDAVAEQVGKLNVNYVVMLNRQFKKTYKRMKEIPNSKIYLA